MWPKWATIIFASWCYILSPISGQNPVDYSLILGDFVSLAGGHGNIAEFGRALRLPTFSERNNVQFRNVGEWFYHRFIFENVSEILEFPFKFAQFNNITVDGKSIQYRYNLETGANADQAVVFAKYQEIGGDIRFTVECIFSRTGMVATYTHADVLDNIMARRRYKRIVPTDVLGYYENVPEKQSQNFLDFAATMPGPENATFSSNNKIYLGQESNKYFLELILDPEMYTLKFPFVIGEKQKMTSIPGKPLEYMFYVEQIENATVIGGEINQLERGISNGVRAVMDKDGVTATYTTANITASRYYRRALPVTFYGTFEAVVNRDEDFTKFMVDLDKPIPSINLSTKVRFYQHKGDEKPYHHHITNVMGTSESVDIEFALGVPTEKQFMDKRYSILYTYTVGEKSVLHINTQEEGGDLNVTAHYTFDGRGIEAVYQRETSTTAPVIAKRFYRKLLPKIVFGRYESIAKSPGFDEYMTSIYFPEIGTKTTTEYVERNGTYFQRFQYGVASPFTEVPFLLGEMFEQVVKETWPMSYTYLSFEGDRTIMRSPFYEISRNSTIPKWGGFTRIGDYREDGYTSIYVSENTTVWRIYRRLPSQDN